MVGIITFVTETTMGVILCVIVVSGLCAIKLAVCNSLDTRQTFNGSINPGFPCEGTLFVLARDGVMYVVPRGKAVIKTDMVREIHCGRVVRSCDQNGHFTYFDDDAEDDDHQQQHSEYAVDHIHNNWSVGSPRSQDMTASLSDDGSFRRTPPESPLVNEMATHETLMI